MMLIMHFMIMHLANNTKFKLNLVRKMKFEIEKFTE